MYFGTSTTFGTNSLQKVICPSNTVNARFGFDLDIDGNFAIISAVGENKAYVYFYNGINWVLYSQLSISGSTSFGYSVSIENDIILVSDIQINSIGAVHIFKNISGTWTLLQTLTENNCGLLTNCLYGLDVEYSDDNIVVYNENAYFIYQNVNNSFSLTQTIENANSLLIASRGKTFMDIEEDILVCKMFDTGWSMYQKINSQWQYCQSFATGGNAVDIAYDHSKILLGTENPGGTDRNTSIYLLNP